MVVVVLMLEVSPISTRRSTLAGLDLQHAVPLPALQAILQRRRRAWSARASVQRRGEGWDVPARAVQRSSQLQRERVLPRVTRCAGRQASRGDSAGVSA